MDEKYYFQDNPIDDYQYDFVGFEEEVMMIKEGIESDSKVIGLVSEYGSGKSTIIKLLKKEIDLKKYNIVNINLFDPDGKNDKLEAHKRMFIQLANNKYESNPIKLSYILKRINPNYKTIDISTKNKMSSISLGISLFFLFFNFLYSKNLLSCDKLISNIQYDWLKETLNVLLDSFGIVGFFVLFFVILKSNFVYNYLKGDNDQELNEFDLNEILRELIDEDKITIIVIDDLDRLKRAKEVEKFIKELNVYYSNMKNFKFIISITPTKFLNMSKGTVDNKYKPFNLVVNLPSIKNSDYDVILKALLKSKREVLNELPNLNFDESLEYWTWLSFGRNLNIRRLKHRINDTIHLYKTLGTRFKNRYVNLKTCIAITYLKDEYEDLFMNLIKENEEKQFDLKNIIEEYLVKKEIIDRESGIRKDIYELLKGDYFDSNIEMYCYNYSKLNEIFDSNEYILNQAYIKNTEYIIDDVKILEIIQKNDTCLIKAIDKRTKLNIGVPSNVFNRNSIVNYLINNKTAEFLELFYRDMLKIDSSQINITKNRLMNIKDSDFFNDNNVELYINTISNYTLEKGNLDSIEKSREILLEVFKDNVVKLKELYTNSYPIMTKEEMKIISDKSLIFDFINKNKINEKNLKDIIECIDLFYTNKELDKIIDFIRYLDEKNTDYYLKNCKSLSKITKEEKERLFEDNFEYLDINNLDEISRIISNFEYSFEKLEQKAIDMFNSGNIDKNKFASFINNLPNVNECILKRLLNDDCDFEINDYIIEEFQKKDLMYGYVKFKTFKDKMIPSGNRKIENQYEKIYSNEKSLFNDYMKNSKYFLQYIKENKIYNKYDLKRFMIMRYVVQNEELFEYAISNLEVNEGLNDYILDIEGIDISIDKLNIIIDTYKEKIKILEIASRNKLIKNVDRSSKTKLIWIWRKKHV